MTLVAKSNIGGHAFQKQENMPYSHLWKQVMNINAFVYKHF